MRALLIVLSIGITVTAVAQSNYETLQQPDAKGSEQHTAQKERGTEEAPIFAKIIHPEKTSQALQEEEDKKREEADDRARKARADEKLVELTGDLALYTKLLFAATAALAIVTCALVAVGFRQVKDAKDSIAAAVTAANAAKASTELAERQFVATNRPRLIVRSVTIARGIGSDSSQRPLYQIGTHIGGSLTVVNAGETDAQIIGGVYRFYWTNRELPMQHPWIEEGKEKIRPLFGDEKPIILGRAQRFVTVSSIDPLDRQITGPNIIDGCLLYLMGIIRYADIGPMPRERTMSFCRLWHSSRFDPSRDGWFEPVINPDYEYED